VRIVEIEKKIDSLREFEEIKAMKDVDRIIDEYHFIIFNLNLFCI